MTNPYYQSFTPPYVSVPSPFYYHPISPYYSTVTTIPPTSSNPYTSYPPSPNSYQPEPQNSNLQSETFYQDLETLKQYLIETHELSNKYREELKEQIQNISDSFKKTHKKWKERYVGLKTTKKPLEKEEKGASPVTLLAPMTTPTASPTSIPAVSPSRTPTKFPTSFPAKFPTSSPADLPPYLLPEPTDLHSEPLQPTPASIPAASTERSPTTFPKVYLVSLPVIVQTDSSSKNRTTSPTKTTLSPEKRILSRKKTTTLPLQPKPLNMFQSTIDCIKVRALHLKSLFDSKTKICFKLSVSAPPPKPPELSPPLSPQTPFISHHRPPPEPPPF
ncbi:uncharacterized protein LOC131613887 [Vicia villosa]|uniref:uncharacterized protein LOC131613887 n=1 Tax=Vicia villosa TaxID=3911 RepID=UPI00273A7585|nr:uncharacterized protein LOC131613887 [Vicia villosa]